MRVLYLSVSYVPSRSASSVHAMRMCAALADAGHDIELVSKLTPSRQEAGVADDFVFYGVPGGFRISKLDRPPYRGGGLVFLREVRRLLRRQAPPLLVYSRDLAGALLAARGGHPVLFEAHGVPRSALDRALLRRLLRRSELQRIVFISAALERIWREEGLLAVGVPTLVAPDASDPLPASDPAGASSRTGLRAGYVGHLYPGRGVELILELAADLPDVAFDFVGGRQNDLAAWTGTPQTPNVRFHGFVAPVELPKLYREFDILLMPYQRSVGVRSGKSDTAAWMSPMKMFEYMAAGKAIVSSDLPVLREVLEDGRNALLVDPDDPNAWRQAIERLAADEALRRQLGQRAREDFERHYTWAARAHNVLAGIDL